MINAREKYLSMPEVSTRIEELAEKAIDTWTINYSCALEDEKNVLDEVTGKEADGLSDLAIAMLALEARQRYGMANDMFNEHYQASEMLLDEAEYIFKKYVEKIKESKKVV